MNRGIKVLQTSALPLGYVAVFGFFKGLMFPAPCGRDISISTGNLSVVRLTKVNGHKLFRARVFLERITGIEPATSTLARSRSTK